MSYVIVGYVIFSETIYNNNDKMKKMSSCLKNATKMSWYHNKSVKAVKLFFTAALNVFRDLISLVTLYKQFQIGKLAGGSFI